MMRHLCEKADDCSNDEEKCGAEGDDGAIEGLVSPVPPQDLLLERDALGSRLELRLLDLIKLAVHHARADLGVHQCTHGNDGEEKPGARL
jgi:hypothetical protein